MLGVPSPKLFLLESAALYEEVANSLQVPLEPAIIPAVESETALKSDPIHPNAAGYRRIAEAVAALLREAGAL